MSSRSKTRKPHRRDGRRYKRDLLIRGAILAALFALVTLGPWAKYKGLLGPTQTPAGRSDMATYHNRQFTVIRVIDGDTFDIKQPDTVCHRPVTRVRLWGVDTPETNKPDTPVQHFGPEATAFTKAAVLGKTVTLRLAPNRHSRGNYRRLLAYAYLGDGRMLNRELVTTGHAYADPRFDHPFQREFQAAMKTARKQGIGLWAEATKADLPYYLRKDR